GKKWIGNIGIDSVALVNIHHVCAHPTDLLGISDTADVIVTITPLSLGIEYAKRRNAEVKVELQRLVRIEPAGARKAGEQGIVSAPGEAHAALARIVPGKGGIQWLADVMNVYVRAHVILCAKLNAESCVHAAKPDGVLVFLRNVPFPVERRGGRAALLAKAANERGGRRC